MPESIPASLIIDTLKDTFREARAARAAEGWGPPASEHLGWILSVPDTHQKTVLAALDKEESIRVLTCATEDEATTIAAGLYTGGLYDGTEYAGLIRLFKRNAWLEAGVTQDGDVQAMLMFNF